MQAKVLQFETSAKAYERIAQKKREKKDYQGCLFALFSAYELSKNDELLLFIARCYEEVGEWESSNEFLFYYLSVAPKSCYGIAYEQLSKNFYNLGNLFLSYYYINERQAFGNVEDVEFVRTLLEQVEDMAQDIEKPFSLVHPISKKRVGKMLTIAEDHISRGEFEFAKAIYQNLPYQSLDISAFEDYLLVLEITNDLELASKVLKQMFEVHGEKLETICSACLYNRAIENFERAKYYYNKIDIEEFKKEINTPSLLACASAVGDFDNSKVFLKKLLKESPQNGQLNFYLGLAGLFTNDFELAKTQFIKTGKLYPSNYVYTYFATRIQEIGAEQLLDEFDKKDLATIFPKAMEKRALDFTLTVAGKNKKGKIKVDKIISCYINSLLESLDHRELFILILGLIDRCEGAVDILLRYLLDAKGNTEVKQSIIYALLQSDYGKDISLTNNGIFVKLGHSRLEQKYGQDYFGAYNALLSSENLWANGIGRKIKKSIKKVYNYSKGSGERLSQRQIFCVVVCMLEPKRERFLIELCKTNECDYNEIVKIAKLIR